MLTLTSDDRKAMSRRLVKIDQEIDFFSSAATNNTSDAAIYQQSDDMNKALMTYYNAICASYEAEKRALNGQVATTFSESDVQDSAEEISGNIFYPFDVDLAINNPNLIPGTIDTDDPPDGQSDQMVDAVNGVAASTDSQYEQNILSNPPVSGANSGDGLTQLISIIKNGFTPSTSLLTTLTSNYVPGSGTMHVAIGTNFANGEFLLAYTSSAAGLFLVKSGGGSTTLTVYEVIPPLTTISFLTSIVNNSFSGFTNTERNTLVASTAALQPILTGLSTTGTNSITSKVLAWETKVDAENSALASNDEERSTQQSQNNSAVTNNNNTKLVIDAWQALSNTGSSGKFVDSSLLTLSTQITSRTSVVSTRLTQISGALGSVTDNGDGSVTFSDNDDIYPARYKFLNLRINRTLGTLKQVVNLGKNSSMLTSMVDLLNSSKDEYDLRMYATKLANDADGSTQIEVEDASGFALNDLIYIVSETQPEISVTLNYIDGNKLVLSSKVSADYILDDLVRAYKLL